MSLKNFKIKEDLTNQMINYGLWQSVSEIEKQLLKIQTKSEKTTALKTQLNFRKIVLNQPVEDPKLYQFSAKGGHLKAELN